MEIIIPKSFPIVVILGGFYLQMFYWEIFAHLWNGWVLHVR